MSEKQFNRDLYNRNVSIKKLKETQAEDDKVVGGSGKRKNFIDVADGLNKIRIAMHHEDENFYKLRCVHKVKVEGDNGDLRNTVVLNAKIHGGMKRDIIEEYVSFVKSKLDSNKDKDADKIKAITDWKSGLLPNNTWWAYAFKLVKGDNGIESNPGIFEFKKAVRDQLSDVIAAEEADDTIEVDPFTHPDEGRPILLTYDSKAKKSADYYKVSLSKKASVLTDEDLQWLFEQPSLTSQLSGVYDKKQFSMAIEGLRFFDSENDIDLFEEDEFQDILKELESDIKAESKPVESSKTKTSKKEEVVEKKSAPKKKEEVEEEDEVEEAPKGKKVKDGDIFDDMDRDDLKEWIGENLEEGSYTLKKSMSDDDIRDMIREKAKTLKKKSTIEEEDEEDPIETKSEEEDKPKDDKKKRPTLDELKQKFGKKA